MQDNESCNRICLSIQLNWKMQQQKSAKGSIKYDVYIANNNEHTQVIIVICENISLGTSPPISKVLMHTTQIHDPYTIWNALTIAYFIIRPYIVGAKRCCVNGINNAVFLWINIVVGYVFLRWLVTLHCKHLTRRLIEPAMVHAFQKCKKNGCNIVQSCAIKCVYVLRCSLNSGNIYGANLL